MKNLTKIIGPAPSEISTEEYLPRLLAERSRVSSQLTDFRERMSGFKAERKSSGAKPKKLTPGKYLQALDAMGITEDMLNELAKASKGE